MTNKRLHKYVALTGFVFCMFPTEIMTFYDAILAGWLSYDAIDANTKQIRHAGLGGGDMAWRIFGSGP